MTAPSTEAAYDMGAKGGPVVEEERLAFEAWMRGHCWALHATWNGSQYLGTAESSRYLCPHATQVRGLWAAWRDRAALAGGEVQINESPEHSRRTGAPDRRRYDFLWWPAFRDRRLALAGRRVDDGRRAREFEDVDDDGKKEAKQ